MIHTTNNNTMLHASAPGPAPAHTSTAPIPVAAPTPSYWLKGLNNNPARARPAPSRDQPAQLPAAADVVIIGGGIAGVSTAYHLRKSRPELQVIRRGGWVCGTLVPVWQADGVKDRIRDRS